jgi:regulatory protein
MGGPGTAAAAIHRPLPTGWTKQKIGHSLTANVSKKNMQGDPVSLTVEESTHYTLRLLARREYSSQELRQKLFAREVSETHVEQVLEALQTRGFQSDTRFAEMTLRHSYQRQHGPEKARYKLRQTGIPDQLIRATMDAFEQDWFELAKDVRAKKFGDGDEWRQDYREKSRQMRFLVSRGFTRDQIDYAFADTF